MSDGVAVGAVGAGFAVTAGGLTGWFGLEPWPVPAVPGPPVEGAASERAAEPELAPEPELAAPEPAALELAAPEPAPLAPTAEPLDAAGAESGCAHAELADSTRASATYRMGRADQHEACPHHNVCCRRSMRGRSGFRVAEGNLPGAY